MAEPSTVKLPELPEPYALHLGDSREVLKGMAEASVDSIVTDPPYHLTTGKKGGTGPASVNLESPYGRARVTTGFMGMTWDGGDVAQDAAFWAEALRVLKPGGYLLAFSGTRTYHRMTCAIEDAGFEVRDQLQWIYASGFPKSHNLDNLRGEKICGCDDRQTHHPASDAEPALHGVRVDVSPAAIARGESQDAELQPAMQRGAAGTRVGAPRAQGAAGTQDLYAHAGGEEPGMEGRGDGVQEARQLQGRAVCASAGVGAADGPEGRLPDGASASDGRMVRLPANADGSGASRQSRPDAKQSGESGAVAGQPEPQAGGAWPVCGGCGKPVLPKGLGTALKPAHEPIVLARKPLIGSVAVNVLAYGTGALNIDGCRIDGGVRPLIESMNEPSANAFGNGLNGSRHAGETTLGRWPANIIHDGSDEVVAAFPDSEGSGPARTLNRSGGLREGGWGMNASDADAVQLPDAGTGSAARFFAQFPQECRFKYCAKASKEDRDEGCDSFTAVHRPNGNKWTDQDYRVSRGERPASAESGPRKNVHPTVKPTDLMRYLCRLVTPKGGVVLDPFMGSGSTGKAAMLEGFQFVGIDLTPEYVEIARARIEFARKQGYQPELLEPA